MSVLHKENKPDEGNVFKFDSPGDRIHAEYKSRRTVTTKQGEGKILECEIFESRINGGTEAGPSGQAVVFESGHITQLVEKYGLKDGDAFILQFCGVDKKTRFKRF